MSSSKPFEVWTVLVVDRPELRGPTYHPVAPGTRSFERHQFATQGQAVRCFQSCLRGDWDFASEYIAKAQVVSYHGVKGSPRSVRKQVERVRLETRQQRARALLSVASARRGNILAFYDGWYAERCYAQLMEDFCNEESTMEIAA